MAEELITGTNVDEGTPDTGTDGSQTTGDGLPTEDGGQPDTDGQTATPQGPDGSQEDTFFDPRDVADDPKLNAAYKNMQRAYTKKMQGVADQRKKIDAYDAFYQNPLEQIQRVAQQYGYQLTNQQAQQVAQQAQAQPSEPWQPQSWEEVSTKIEQLADQKAQEYLQQKMGPVMNQVQTMRKESIESQLAEIDPTWQQYEGEMKEVLQTHPTLANDPSKLYRLSVPQDVLESRATQAALRKMETRQSSAQISGHSTTPKSPQMGLPDKPVSFAEAVSAAKKALAEQGIRPGE
jgi:hypothetical protein